MKPILSICIPTYNRANWLRSSLWNWLSQVKESNGLVELIVCDNASADHTQQVIEEAREWGNFQYHCNTENIGPIRNIYRLVHELAQGEFVWVVGDDDLPSVGALQQVINVLQKCSGIDYIYVNYSHWNPPKDIVNNLIESSDLDFSNTVSLELETRFINQIAELVAINVACFTPIYCSIMRKQDACNAYSLGIFQEAFSCIETTIPHAVYIAKNLLDKSAYYIGKPCILASYDISWKNFFALTFVEYMPELYRLIEKNGGHKPYLESHKRKIMNFLPSSVRAFQKSNASWRDKIRISYKYYANYPIFLILKNDIDYAFRIIRTQGGKVKRFMQKILYFA